MSSPIKFIVDMIVQQASDSNSPFYAPKVLLSLKTPQLEPLTLHDMDAGQLDLPTVGSASVKFTSLTVSGLSNMMISKEDVTVDGITVNVVAHVSKLSPTPAGVPENLRLVGNLEIASAKAGTMNGQMDILIKEATLNVQATIDLATGKPVVKFSQIVLKADTSSKNMTTEIGVDKGKLISGLVDKVFEMGSVRELVLSNINAEIKSQLDVIGTEVTKIAGSYLK